MPESVRRIAPAVRRIGDRRLPRPFPRRRRKRRMGGYGTSPSERPSVGCGSRIGPKTLELTDKRLTAAPPLPRRQRNNPLSGALYLVRGLVIVTRPGIRAYVVAPLSINVVLFALLIYLGASWLGGIVEHMLPDWLDFLGWVLVPIFVLAALIAGFFTFNLVANLIAAPFNGLLAEAVERHLTGRPPPSGDGWRTFVPEFVAAFAAEARKLAYVAVRALPLLALFLIPGVNVVASIAWMVLGAWMLAVTYVDYPMANHGIGFAEVRRRLRGRCLLGLGFGGAVMAALAVPVLNFLVIPCAVAGATAMWVEQIDGAGPVAAGTVPPAR